MDEAARAEKLAQAKKRLKQFESQRRLSPVPTSNLGGARTNEGRISALSNASGHSVEKIERAEENVPKESFTVISTDEQEREAGMERQTNCSSSASSSVNGVPEEGFTQVNQPYQGSSSGSFRVSPSPDIARLIAERDAARQAFDQVHAQLNQLHEHYSQLHSAYSQLSDSGVHSDTEKQIHQLQSALSLLIDEKSKLLSDARALKEENEKIRLDLEASKKAAIISPDSTTELREVRNKLDQANSMIVAQGAELDNIRKQSADFRAQLLSVQHERSEAQLRVKALMREKDANETEMVSLRKEMQMKSLHLKQLTVHKAHTPQDAAVQEEQIQKLHDDLDTLTAELNSIRAERDSFIREANSARVQFEEHRRELSQKNCALETQMDELLSAKNMVENRNLELEQQIELMHQDLGKRVDESEVVPVQVKHSEEEIQKLLATEADKMAREWQKRMDEAILMKQNEIQAKVMELQEVSGAYEELMFRYKSLENRFNDMKANASELLSLSEQLQNEKATVSRAVAQNKELKEQLIETEDRLMKVTNEKMEIELARQALEYQFGQLQQQTIASDSSQTKLRYSSLEHEMQPSEPDVISLSEQLRNEKATVSRAVAHNQELKEQLIETEERLMKVTNEKMEIELAKQSVEYRLEQLQQQLIVSQNSPLPLESSDSPSPPREHQLEQELNEVRMMNEQITEALHRSRTQIEQMQQLMMSNAEDENQNTIRVELGQALEQINNLALQNDQLRNEANTAHQTEQFLRAEITRLSELQEAIGQIQRVPEDDSNSLPSTQNTSGEISHNSSSSEIGSDIWARTELDKKFQQAMTRIADLEENLDRLEHINVQLQLENETIADHVIIYQHQRRVIRERIKAKDEQLAVAEAERKRITQKCQELQRALQEVIGHERFSKVMLATGARKCIRTYSSSTVDEFSGDEAVQSGGEEEEELEVERAMEATDLDPHFTEEGRCSPPSQDAVQRIINIIIDINRPLSPVAQTLENLHCSQCVGELQSV